MGGGRGVGGSHVIWRDGRWMMESLVECRCNKVHNTLGSNLKITRKLSERSQNDDRESSYPPFFTITAMRTTGDDIT